ncbi:hypothetical protein CEXT_290561 [Caerostris extrusa]|uniref:Uncharacterized protein n=1 Tax=Caerostris extrusa TaxID=172846 RepID=A0AAV4UTU5_CAEEX|nr:hypothetical protein CEXT_290561 [Caerostris extrusa]
MLTLHVSYQHSLMCVHPMICQNVSHSMKHPADHIQNVLLWYGASLWYAKMFLRCEYPMVYSMVASDPPIMHEEFLWGIWRCPQHDIFP